MNKSINVLFVAKYEDDIKDIISEMERCGFDVFSERVDKIEDLSVELKNRKWNLVISDFAIDKITFEEVLTLIKRMDLEIPLIVVSDIDDYINMLYAIDRGCSDYIVKSDMKQRLGLTIYRILKQMEVCRGHKVTLKEYYIENKRLIDTLSCIGDGVIITDMNGNITMLNKVAEYYTGWERQEAIGEQLTAVFRIVDNVSRIQAENPLNKAIMERTGTGLKKNTVLISKDNTERYISASCSPIISGQNQLVGAILIFRDITRIKQAENELINEQQNLNAMFDAAPVGMLLLGQNATIKKANNKILDLANNRGVLQIRNNKIGDLFNCPNSYVNNKGCGNSYKCGNCELNAALRSACDSEKAIINTEIEYMLHTNESKTKLWLRINSVPVIIEGERNTLVIIEDITGLKQLQEKLERNNIELQHALEELKVAQNQLIQQEKLAGIGQLAAGVAHEINNPLGFVMSNFETLKKYFGKYKKALDLYEELRNEINDLKIESLGSKILNIDELEQRENLNFVTEDAEDLFRDTNEGLERIGKIITSLRLFSHIDQQNERDEYDLNEGIHNTLIVAHNEIKYCASVTENLQNVPTIYANGGQINQVLLNIIVNAAHAIKSKNSNEMGLIKISSSCDDKFIYCSIEDNGIGISEDHLNKIFDPFYTTKSVGKGTGLGLSISYDIIVNKHGGEISVKSKYGIGTKFTIKLPLK